MPGTGVTGRHGRYNAGDDAVTGRADGVQKHRAAGGSKLRALRLHLGPVDPGSGDAADQVGGCPAEALDYWQSFGMNCVIRRR